MKQIEVQVEQTGRPSPKRMAATGHFAPERGEPSSQTRGISASVGPADAIPAEASKRGSTDPSRSAGWASRAPDEPDGLLPDVYASDEIIGRGTIELLGERAISEPRWDPIVPGRRHGKAEPGTAPHPAPEGQMDGPELQMETRAHGDVPQESRDRAVGEDRRVLLPQPPKPADPPVFALEPARRVMMMVGDAGNEVRVLVHETNGDVSIRFDAPHALRANLEASAHQLVESMSREQISLADLSFSGPSHGDDPNGRPRDVPRQDGRKTSPSDVGAATPTTDSHLEFARPESRIQIRA